MKKYLFVSLTVLFVAALWAADAVVQLPEPAVAIQGFGQVEWGVDFGSATEGVRHGFKNKAQWRVQFPLIKKGDFRSSRTDGPVYAEVVLKDVELNIRSRQGTEKNFHFAGKVDGLSAKFVFYGAYLTVYNRPSFKTNYADLGKPFRNDDFSNKDDNGFQFKPGFDGAGFKLGYANRDFLGLDVGVKFGSNGAWDSVEHSKYGFGFDFALKPLDKMLAFKVNVNSTFTGDYNTGVDQHVKTVPAVDVGAELTSEPVDGLKFALGFDGGWAFTGGPLRKEGNVFGWDMVFKTEYKWIGGGVYYGSLGTPFGNASNRGFGDMAVWVKFETEGNKSEDSYLVEGLDAGVYLGMFKLLSKMENTHLPVLVKAWASYKATLTDSMWIKPFASLWVETNHKLDVTKDTKPYVGVAYDLGVTYSPMEKVEIQAKWAHGKLTDNVYASGVNMNKDGHTSVITATANQKQHYGTFVLGVKVKY